MGATAHSENERLGTSRRLAALDLVLQSSITSLSFGVGVASLLGFANVILPSIGIGVLGGLVGLLAARHQ